MLAVWLVSCLYIGIVCTLITGVIRVSKKWDENLFKQMVQSKVYSRPGLMKIPLDAMREYHDALGMEANERVVTTISLLTPRGGVRYFKYGNDSSKTIPPQLREICFYNEENDLFSPIADTGNDRILYEAIDRYFRKGEFPISEVTIDDNGRLDIGIWYSGDIMATYSFDLLSDESGCQFIASDNGDEVWIWRNGDVASISSTVTWVIT